MTYRELLELYRKGELDENICKEVESDIEKQNSISEYLLEKSKSSDDTTNTDNQSNRAEDGDEDKKIVFMIQNYIRKAFIKMGITVGTIILAVILCAIFILPHVVSMFYYNPTDIVAKNAEGEMETNRMSLDLSVYSELFLPGYYRNNVMADSDGYGKYDIAIHQNASYNGRFTTVNGELERGKLTLYNKNILVKPAGNVFLFPNNEQGVNYKSIDAETGEVDGPAGTKTDAYKRLEELSEDEWYMAYVSLSDIKDYERFYQWFDEKEMSYGTLWCGVYAEDEDGYLINQNIGFTPNPAGVCLDWDRETYPRLCMLDNNDEYMNDSDSAEAMQTHFISLLTYQKDNNDILTMMGDNSVDFDGIIKSVERDGLRIHGFAIGAQKDTIMELSKDSAVSYIYTSILN